MALCGSMGVCRDNLRIGLGAMILALGMLACESERARTGRGGRTGGTNTSTIPGGGNNNGGNNNGGNQGTASVDLQDLLEYCAKLSACDDDEDLSLSLCANQAALFVAHARQYADPKGITGCIAAAKTVKTCDALPECDLGGRNSSEAPGSIDTERNINRCTWDENVERQCAGTVAINGNENKCQYDCAATNNQRELNLGCYMTDSGFATCGVGDGCISEQDGCVGSIRARCQEGVYQGFDDCARRDENDQCVLDSSGQTQCGLESCTQEGESCRGTVRVQCEDGVLQHIYDCAESGFKCVEGQDTNGNRKSACGERYTGCENSDCKNDEVIICRSGAETPIDCSRLDPVLSTCQLYQADGDDFTPLCAAASSARDCTGITASCDGNVATVCVGGKNQTVNCETLMTDGRCVMQIEDGLSDVRCGVPSGSGNSGGDGPGPGPGNGGG